MKIGPVNRAAASNAAALLIAAAAMNPLTALPAVAENKRTVAEITTSGLVFKDTLRIEELMRELKKRYTIVIVTHNMQQAARVSDYTAFLYIGQVVEFGATKQIFTAPGQQRTEEYITGRFG